MHLMFMYSSADTNFVAMIVTTLPMILLPTITYFKKEKKNRSRSI
jgi:hypothetical protein